MAWFARLHTWGAGASVGGPILRDSSGVCKAGMGALLRGSEVRDTGLGDHAMKVMLRVQR